MEPSKPPLIRNQIAESFLELSGRDSKEVVYYLEQRKKHENDPEALREFEDSFRCSSKRAEFYCAITDLVNRRPFVMVGGTVALLYNIVWWGWKLFSG